MPLEVLIVDDERGISRIIEMKLKRVFGEEIRISVYNTLEEVLLRIENGEPFDIVITDYHVPHNKEGLKIIKAVRERSTQTKVVLMSGNISTEEVVTAKPDSFLSKPFSLDEIVGKITEWSLEVKK